MSRSQTRDRLQGVLAEPVAALGLDLEGVEVTFAGKRSVVRVAIDKDGGVDMDAVAEATRAISAALDASDAMGSGSYTLEVGSPGVDRPLTLPRHWRRNARRLVKVTLTDGSEVLGRIGESDDLAVSLDVDGATQSLSYADVAKARVQIEFTKG